jgi:ParB-like chromosome segregation protein Spo0J
MDEELREHIDEYISNAEDSVEAYNEVVESAYDSSPVTDVPVGRVKLVDVDNVRANTWNPNEVADEEMKLLYKSIKADGYTQPVVVVEVEDAADDEAQYEVIDGFHRYVTMKRNQDIRERSNRKLPVTVLDKSMNERRASTVRHNRASGVHTASGKSEVVFEMLQDGWDDERICEELGMEPEELVRIKHTTGFAKLFDDADYSQPWKATQQLEIEKEFPDIDHP